MELRQITLKNALPSVFKGDKNISSDVWLTDVTFITGKRYIVSAESGTGKSSLCAYIYGSRRDYEGFIFFNGEDIRGFRIPDWQRLRRESIAYLPQELSLFPELTARENIILKNDLTGHFTREKIDSLMARIGLSGRENFPVGKMSIGQQQRVAIIRALCQPFRFILLDEPVSHLDEHNNRIVASIIEEEAAHNNAAVISTSVGNHLLLSDAVNLHL